MNLTIRECVQDSKIDSNPTHYTKLDKNIEKIKKIGIGPKSGFRVFFAIFAL